MGEIWSRSDGSHPAEKPDQIRENQGQVVELTLTLGLSLRSWPQSSPQQQQQQQQQQQLSPFYDLSASPQVKRKGERGRRPPWDLRSLLFSFYQPGLVVGPIPKSPPSFLLPLLLGW